MYRSVWLPYVAPSTAMTGATCGGGCGVRVVDGGFTPMSSLFWSEIPALYLMRMANCRHRATAASRALSFAAIVPVFLVGGVVAVASEVANKFTAFVMLVESG